MAPGSDAASLHHILPFPKFSFNPTKYTKDLHVPLGARVLQDTMGEKEGKADMVLPTSSPVWTDGLRQLGYHKGFHKGCQFCSPFVHSFIRSLIHSASQQFWSTYWKPGLLCERRAQPRQVTPLDVEMLRAGNRGKSTPSALMWQISSPGPQAWHPVGALAMPAAQISNERHCGVWKRDGLVPPRNFL